jgi:hypothetical protein
LTMEENIDSTHRLIFCSSFRAGTMILTKGEFSNEYCLFIL